MIERNNIFIYSEHDKDSLDKKSIVGEVLIEEGFSIVEDLEDANVILSVGSDGSFLQAVRKTHFRQDCLYAGLAVTNKPSLYCDFNLDNLDALVTAFRDNDPKMRNYPLIEVTIDNHKTFYCLNELSIRSNIIRTFVLDVIIDDSLFQTFLGDGLIISTPTGSTAYNKSVDGAIVDPLLPCFQVTELASVNNNTYRTLGSPFILSGDRKLRLRVHQDGNDFPAMAADNEAIGIRKVESVSIELSQKKVRTIRLKNNSFWEKVQRIYL